jgi:hypothetical protein
MEFMAREWTLSHVTYRIVEHDHGWAYRVGDTFSQTYLTREAAHKAAAQAAAEQRQSGDTHDIQYETEDGEWRTESARGDDRPDTEVRD